MKKSILLIFLYFFSTAYSYSQITIGPSDMPVANDTVVISTTTDQWSIDPTLTGTHYNWDFSYLTHTDIQLDTFKAMNSFPFGYQYYFNNQSQHPTHKANFGLRGQDVVIPGVISITNVHDFYQVDNQGYKNVGYGATIEGFPVPVRNIPIDTVYKFPLNYGDVYDSYSESELNIPDMGYYGRKKTVNAEVDGWGQVETPYGIFDCLRVKMIIEQTDTIYMDDFGFGISIPRPTETHYHWLTNGQKIPVLQITVVMGLITSIRYKDFPRDVSTNNLSVLNFNLSPNPADEFVVITLAETKMGFVEITNLNGQVVKRFDINSHNHSTRLDISNLPGGLYLVKITADNHSAVRKLVIR